MKELSSTYVKETVSKYMRKLRNALITTYTVWHYEHGKIQDDLIAINSKYGMDLAGNMLRILEEISTGKYGRYRVVLLARKEAQPRIKKFLKTYHIQNVHLASTEMTFTGWAEQARYIFSDVAMPFRFIKKEGQIFVDTWHGTPLKTMGKRVTAERHSLGNIQRGFSQADYLVYPNRFMEKVMLRDYMVENICSGKVMHEGYPRNTVFFNEARRQEMRRLLGIENKKVYVYMPTHRGDMWKKKNAEQITDVTEYLRIIDQQLSDQELMYVKMHLFNGKPIDFSQYTRICPFPSDYEVYDVLNTADCLITDYSSVFFDFANTGKKIILFAYDEKEYIEDRGGLYLSLDALPFPKARTVEELLDCMKKPKEYDDTAFRAEYCTYDRIDATQRILRHVLNGENSTECVKVGNGKQNVMVFAGSLRFNGITSACKNLLRRLEKEEDCNYFASFFGTQMNNAQEQMNAIPENTPYLAMYSDLYKTLWETLLYKIYIKKGHCKYIPKAIHRMYQREWNRYFYGIPFKAVVDFDGYQADASLLLAHAQCTRTIFVHSDMEKEIETRALQQVDKLRYLYNEYDYVAVVGESLIEPTARISGDASRIRLVNNQFDVDTVKQKAEEPIKFDEETVYHTSNPDGLLQMLDTPGMKIISVGRYSKEKNHKLLIKAFDRLCEEHPDAKLIIIGGHGEEWDTTLQLVNEQKNSKSIVLIKCMSNPYAVMKKCDLFVLPSLYEGMGLTLLEATAVNLPVISTRVGITSLYSSDEIILIENTEEDLIDAINQWLKHGVKNPDFDWNKINKQSLVEFKSCLN